MAFLYAGRCTSTATLTGKTAVITGCNTGIGKLQVVDLYKRGAKVIMACRDLKRANDALDDIKKTTTVQEGLGHISIKQLDLASFQSIRLCAKQILDEEERIDILINNAGVMLCPKQETQDGFEMQFGTNHIGHFLFTLLLIPRIKASAPSRIINVSSRGHSYGRNEFDDINWEKTPYNSLRAYGDSKLANIHFTTELARRLEGTGVTTYAVHPGIVRTELARHVDSLYFPGFRRIMSLTLGLVSKSPEQGAQTQIHCAVDEKAGKETGLYYSDCKPITPACQAQDKEAAAKLWDLSLKWVQLESDPLPPPS